MCRGGALLISGLNLRERGRFLMNRLTMSTSLSASSQVTDDYLANLGTVGIVTAGLMAILIFML
jgi:hypothetical protein